MRDIEDYRAELATYSPTYHVNGRGLLTGTVWAPCRCGKVVQRRVVGHEGDTEDALVLRLLLYTRSMCRRCEQDLERERDWCPENVNEPGSFGRCKLTREHTGRCEPHDWPH